MTHTKHIHTHTQGGTIAASQRTNSLNTKILSQTKTHKSLLTPNDTFTHSKKQISYKLLTFLYNREQSRCNN